MQRREITLDNEADRALDEISELYGGNRSEAVNELLKAHSKIENLLDEIEGAKASELIRQKEASEASFRMGTAADWESVKRRNGL
jgi:metal-responsive CopG/Arc/MetJ family transcriptional regulator